MMELDDDQIEPYKVPSELISISPAREVRRTSESSGASHCVRFVNRSHSDDLLLVKPRDELDHIKTLLMDAEFDEEYKMLHPNEGDDEEADSASIVVFPVETHPSLRHTKTRKQLEDEWSAFLHQFDTEIKARAPNELVLQNHNTSLRAVGADAKHVVGCAHDDRECQLCNESINRDDSNNFLNTDVFDAERRAILYTQMNNYAMVRDSITWLMAHREWLSVDMMHFYFENTYPLLSDLMVRINALSPFELDGRNAMAMQAASIHDVLEMVVYCSWLYLPNPYLSRVFYLPTKRPTPEMVHEYLNVMLGMPESIIEMIAHSTVADETKREEVTRRRIKSRGKLKSPRVSDTLADLENYDPRVLRAERLEKRADLNAIFSVMNPRIVLVSENGHIKRLQIRPDYILKAHPRYINVVFIDLPPDAPEEYDPSQDLQQEKW